jgi:predicted glycogen debranching enzyme
MPKIALGADALNEISMALQKEYITTNGLGGYASSTVTGCNTRRYHGLLVVSRPEDSERLVLLSKLEESIKIGHRYYYLSTNKYTENHVHPRGYLHLRKYEQTPFPRFIFTIKDITLVKEIFMIRGSRTTVIRYNIFGGGEDRFNFVLHPLLSFRKFHAIQRENHDFSTATEYSDGVLALKPYPEMPQLKLRAPGMEYKDLKNWYKNFQYEKEKERGLGYLEDLFNPGYFFTPEVSHFSADVVATCDEELPGDTAEEYKKAMERTELLFDLADASPDDPDEKSLVLAADLHIIQLKKQGDPPRATIVAGYPWFGDWGRDTFISLPGLALCTGRKEEAREILLYFAEHCRDGLIPNRFGDLGTEPVYNTVDASLWYINAIHHYLEATKNVESIKDDLYPVCRSIIENYRKGTQFNIGMDKDGLISAGSRDVQLTWMDAKVEDWVVTPRNGKAVEINALWYNALCIMEKTARQLKDKASADDWEQLSRKVFQSFNNTFWHQREGYLYDNISPDGPDASFRPNQLLAVSLPYPVLIEERQAQVVSKVHERLYIPMGIRSLDPDNPNYRGCYWGSPQERDSAYHMGVAWGWLLGPFIEAFLKANKYSPNAVSRARIMMDLWMGDLLTNGLNTLSEIFDGDEPFTARGCISQAWTVAEALRIKKLLRSL